MQEIKTPVPEVMALDFQRAADGHCDHIKIGDKGWFVGEADMFGTNYLRLVCANCFEKIEEAAKNEPVECHDCGQTFPAKETRKYKPYGFDPHNDEPLTICDNCWEAETHQTRLEEALELSSRDLDYE